VSGKEGFCPNAPLTPIHLKDVISDVRFVCPATYLPVPLVDRPSGPDFMCSSTVSGRSSIA